jgi:hypothetical protein
MNLDLINIGNSANDGTGDDLREAFIKVNNNFTTITVENINTATNIGMTGARVFASTANNSFNFRKLVGGTNINIVEQENTIVFNSTASIFPVSGDTGSLIAGGGIALNIVGGNGISVGANENTKTITINGSLGLDTAPTLGANLDADGFDILNVGNLTLSQIGGADYNNSLGRFIEGFDFGNLSGVYTNILDFVMSQVGVDFGTLDNPTSGRVDLGPIV